MRIIAEKLEELKIDLLLMDIEKPGYYISDSKTIIASNKLDEIGLKEVILHELKHIMDHEDYIILYQKSFAIHSKLECEATNYMISELINESEGYFNYTNVISKYKLSMGFEDILKIKAI